LDNQEYLLTEKEKNLEAQVRKEFVKLFFLLTCDRGLEQCQLGTQQFEGKQVGPCQNG
jgi:hypothetical protein